MRPPDPVTLGQVQAAVNFAPLAVGAAYWGVAGAIMVVISTGVASEALCQACEIWFLRNVTTGTIAEGGGAGIRVRRRAAV
jgi:hypothetical protein